MLTEAEWVSPPLLPVTVNGYVPAAVEALVGMVSVEFPEVLTAAGLKPGVVPAGSPVALRETEPLNPFTAATLAVKVAVFPAVTVAEAGVAVSVKSCMGEVTQKVTDVLW